MIISYIERDTGESKNTLGFPGIVLLQELYKVILFINSENISGYAYTLTSRLEP